VKFKNFKENYFQYPQVRKTALAKIKGEYIDKQANVLARNLQREEEGL
jgi:hypothetical protein